MRVWGLVRLDAGQIEVAMRVKRHAGGSKLDYPAIRDPRIPDWGFRIKD
jgi:hypothetical protein